MVGEISIRTWVLLKFSRLPPSSQSLRLLGRAKGGRGGAKRTEKQNLARMARRQNPVLPFLVFLEKGRKTTKKQGFFIPTEPLKSLEKKRKTVKKTRKSSQGEKTRNSKKNKEGQGTLFETLRKWFLRRSAEGKSGNF